MPAPTLSFRDWQLLGVVNDFCPRLRKVDRLVVEYADTPVEVTASARTTEESFMVNTNTKFNTLGLLLASRRERSRRAFVRDSRLLHVSEIFCAGLIEGRVQNKCEKKTLNPWILAFRFQSRNSYMMIPVTAIFEADHVDSRRRSSSPQTLRCLSP